MHRRLLKPETWIVVGSAMSALGFALSVLMLLQPWRSCVEDDAPAGCPVTQLDANLTGGAFLILGIGAILVLGTLLRPRRGR